MQNCKRCGQKLELDTAFCPKCGTPVKNSDKSQSPEDSSDKTVKRVSDIYGAVRLDNILAGYIIDNRYEIKRKLGQGGFGAVYLVYDRKMHSNKALKVIPDEVANDRESMEQLRHEARVMLRLNHPNIVRVYDFHDEGRIKYIDMEYVEGKTLTDVKLDNVDRKIPEEKVVRYAIQVAEALDYAHKKNILHKDLKPQNVMVTTDGEVKVMDFGIAEVVRSSMTRLKQSSSSGTLVYMSPEQLRGKEVGKESDVYSFGAMLYDLLSGHPPFYRGEIYYQILNEQPERIDGISNWLNTLLQNCLQKDYTDRPRSFSVLVKLLLLDETERELVCQKCGEDVQQSSRTCGYCGAVIRGVSHTQKMDEEERTSKETYKSANDRRRQGLPRWVSVTAIVVVVSIVFIIWYLAEESKRREEIALIEEEHRMEEMRKAEEARIAEEEHRAEQARREEEARRAEEERREAEVRRAEEERRMEEARRAEEERLDEEARRAEEERKAEEARRVKEDLAKETKSEIIESQDELDLNKFYVAVEEMPQIIGGMQALARNLTYPENARRERVEGVVYVLAYVDEQGIVRHTEVARGIGSGCDEAAVEAVMKTRFIPGKQRGQPVRVRVMVPVRFSLPR